MADSTTDATNIVRLTQTRAHKEVFAATAQVEGYWDALCADGTLPSRSEIDPRALESALEYTFVLERVAPGVFRFRIAGRHLNDLMGLDVRGMPLSALFATEARTDIAKIVETICAEPCIKEVFISGGRSIGRGELNGKLFLAPLLDNAGQVTRILGCLQTRGTIGRQPRRFTITDAVTKHLSLEAAEQRSDISQANPMAFAEPAVKYCAPPNVSTDRETSIGSVNPIVGRPALQLVVNNAS